MTLFSDLQSDDAVAQAQKAISLPIGLASPMWFTYAAFTGMGMAYWWMSQVAKPINLEAFALKVDAPALGAAVLDTTAAVTNIPAMVAETIAALQPEPVAPPVTPVVTLDPSAIAVEAVEVSAEVFEEAVGEASKIAATAADDLTRLAGIGPTLAAKLADLGVRTFVDIAAWTTDDLEKMDKALHLKGRAVREGWIDQARQFAAQ